MSRFFSSSARIAIKWLGFEKSKLPTKHQSSLEKAIAPGGSVEQVLNIHASPSPYQLADQNPKKIGKIQQVNIKSRDGNPVHQSHFNRSDKAWIISVRIMGSKLTKTFHIYEDGKATSSVNDKE